MAAKSARPLAKLRRALWSVEPRWMKAGLGVVALPVWLALGAELVFDEHWPPPAWTHYAAAVFFLLALLSTAFIVRAFWRSEL